MANEKTEVKMETNGDAKAIIEAAKKFGAADLIQLGTNGPLVVSAPSEHGGRKIQSVKPFLDEYLKAPERKLGTATLTTLDSFVDHVNRHKDDDTVVFAIDSPTQPGLLAVFDYNESGPAGAPRFGQHCARYSFPLSDEWKAWMKAGGEAMKQAAFAEFLEDRIVDVMDPTKGGDSIAEFKINLGIDLASAQQLMTLARGLSINVENGIANHQNLTSGEAQISFNEKHTTEAGVTLRVPGGFAVAIPVFRLGDRWQIPVRLRYRVQRPDLVWTLALHRTDLIFSKAFEEVVAKAKAGTELPVFFGMPET